MAFERGQWRYSGTQPKVRNNQGSFKEDNKQTSGFSNSSFNDVTSSKKLYNCPICGKRQPTQRYTCIFCTYNFIKRDYDLENTLTNFIKLYGEIPANKLQKIVKDNFYNKTKSLKSSKNILQQYNYLFNSNTSDDKILIVLNSQNSIKNLKKAFEMNNNNSVEILTNESNFNSLLSSINEFEKINKEMSSKYSLKVFKNIDSAKDIIYLKYLNDEIHYIDEKDSEVLNDFIKSYWKYYYTIHESNNDIELERLNLEEEISTYYTLRQKIRTEKLFYEGCTD